MCGECGFPFGKNYCHSVSGGQPNDDENRIVLLAAAVHGGSWLQIPGDCAHLVQFSLEHLHLGDVTVITCRGRIVLGEEAGALLTQIDDLLPINSRDLSRCLCGSLLIRLREPGHWHRCLDSLRLCAGHDVDRSHACRRATYLAAVARLASASVGLVHLMLLPGVSAPDPIDETAGNFGRSVPMVALVGAARLGAMQIESTGVALAVTSGALASGLGYARWYGALPGLTATAAATVQLSVPVLAALAGVLLMAEAVAPRLVIASLMILGGVASCC